MNEAPRFGLRPQDDSKGRSVTREIVIDSGNTVPLAMGSAYYVVNGKLRGLPSGHASNASIAGAIVRLATIANKSVEAVPASTAGYKAEVTFERNQRYICTMDDGSFADDGSDNGKFYDLTDEALVYDIDKIGAGTFSTRQLEGASEATSGKQMCVASKTGLVNNKGGLANTEVFCTINAANWQQW